MGKTKGLRELCLLTKGIIYKVLFVLAVMCKKRIWFNFMVVVLLVSLVSAATNTCHDSSQKIIALSDDTNAHGELWNQNSYGYDICYDEIFGQNFTGANPHEPLNIDKNCLLSLTVVTNAHAGSMGDYATKVCYGDLDCQMKSGNCGAEEIAIMSLSNPTNAHLGKADQYTYKICCKTPKPRWENYNGNVLTDAGLGWKINLVYESTTLVDGEEIDFQVYDDEGLHWGNPGMFDKLIMELKATANNGRVEIGWEISQQDLDKADDLDTFFIWVRDRRSDYLTINPNSINTNPVSNITGPVEGGVYYVNQNIIFSHNSFDTEGPVTVEWDIGDTLSDNTLDSFTHSYTTAGQNIVKLKVMDIKGVEGEDEIVILVVSSPGAFAYVDKPKKGGVVVSEDYVVDFSGEQSYLIDSVSSGSPCTTTVRCLAGECPLETQGSPSCAADPNTKITIQNPSAGFSDLLFTWRLPSDGGAISEIGGLNKKDISYGYSKSGQKTASMAIDYTQGDYDLDETYSTYFTVYDQRQCTENGAMWVKIESGKEIARYDTMDGDKCVGKDGIAGNSDDCCPVGWSCSTNAANPGCQLTNITVQKQCSDYNDAVNCSDDNLQSSKNNPLWDLKGCGLTVAENNVLCSCEWHNDKCGFDISVRNAKDTTSVISRCSYGTTLDDCDGGYQNINIVANLLSGSDASCIDSTEIVPCGRPSIQLPFFGWLQFTVALIGICLIYAILIRRM